MKKIFGAIILFVLVSPLFTQQLDAQESSTLYENDQAPEIRDVEGLRAEFRQYTQDPGSKEVKFEMVLKSNIVSDRVKITWTVNGASAFLEGEEPVRYIAVENGKSYAIPIVVVPSGRGITELFGKAEAFKPGSSYLVTIRKNFASNEAQEILPLTSEYTNAKTLLTVRNIIIIIVLFVGGVAGAFFGFKYFVKWLNKEDAVAVVPVELEQTEATSTQQPLQ